MSIMHVKYVLSRSEPTGFDVGRRHTRKRRSANHPHSIVFLTTRVNSQEIVLVLFEWRSRQPSCRVARLRDWPSEVVAHCCGMRAPALCIEQFLSAEQRDSVGTMRTVILVAAAVPLLLAFPRVVQAEDQTPELHRTKTFDLKDLGALCDGHRDATDRIVGKATQWNNAAGAFAPNVRASEQAR